MIHAAILGAEEVVTARLGRLEPLSGVPAGHDVHLDSKGGDEDVVDHVLSRHDQFNLTTYGHVQLINFALAGRMLELPHPLFADYIDLQSVLRRTVLGEINFRAPDEDAHRDHQRDNRPQRFQFVRAFDRAGNLESVAAPVADDEKDDDQRNQSDEENRHPGDVEVHRIDVAREGRCTFRNWKPRLHYLILNL